MLKKVIKKKLVKLGEINGHLLKSKNNLKFVNEILS